MAEELFQFLLKLKESDVDLSEVSFWTEAATYDNSRWTELKRFKYLEDYKEIELG
jgi:hypothetical protein